MKGDWSLLQWTLYTRTKEETIPFLINGDLVYLSVSSFQKRIFSYFYETFNGHSKDLVVYVSGKLNIYITLMRGKQVTFLYPTRIKLLDGLLTIFMIHPILNILYPNKEFYMF